MFKKISITLVAVFAPLFQVPVTEAAQAVTTTRPAAVRDAPTSASSLDASHTPGGVLRPGQTFTINSVVSGQDPYGTGNNIWLVSVHGNYIWSGNTNYSSAAAAPAPQAQSSGVEQWRGLTSGFFGGETDLALRVMKCESGGNPRAVGGAGEIGLMQIHPIHAAKVGGNTAALYDPATNLRVAKQIRDGSGWAAWTCAR